MAFEELQERLKSEWQTTVDRLQENPAVINLKDRYDALSPVGQKSVVAGAIGALILVLAMPVYNTYLASADSMTQFSEKRSLIRDLLRTYKEAQDNPVGQRPPAVDDVRSRVESILAGAQILPEQNQGVTVTGLQGNLIRDSLVAGVVQVTLSQLNLRQAVNLGADFSSIQGTKLKDLIMNASSKDPRYYDAVYRIVVLKSDASTTEPAAPAPSPRGGGR